MNGSIRFPASNLLGRTVSKLGVCMRERVGLGVAVAVLAALVAGCTSISVEGSPAVEGASKNKNAGLFEPCDIPDDAIRAAGVDPAKEYADFFGVQHTGWEACQWTGSWYYLTVLSTTHSFDDVKQNPNNIELQAATIPGRDAVTYRDVGDKKREICDVAFSSDGGAVIVRAGKKGSKPAEEDPCVMAVRGAVSLNDVLPR